MSLHWVFDPAPPSGKRTGGDAAEYSFRGRIDILVREVVQNSLDARLGPDEPVEVTFKVIDLDGDHRDAFLEAIDWSSIEDNLAAVPEARGGHAIRSAANRMAEEGLRLLVIEDKGTRGLEGPEDRVNDSDTNPYCALVRDELYSDKESGSAGGSYGLGKSVLWAYSGLKTVLFASVPNQPPVGQAGLRLVGRASLPWHETDADGKCTGDGWFGVPVDPQSHNRRAMSAWGHDAERIAASCYCSRASETGLTAVVVGFTEPGEEDRDSAELTRQIASSSLDSFWPAISEGKLVIRVERHENDELNSQFLVDPSSAAGYRQLGQLLERFRVGALPERDRLSFGDEGLVWVSLDLPPRLAEPTHGDVRSKAAVLIRVLAEGEDAGAAQNKIARFRGPGMIIRSDRQSFIAIGARPFVAAVLAGEGAGQDRQFSLAELFLRAAEPPAHDEWVHDTRRIKQDYRAHGTKAKLDRFELAIKQAITRLVTKPQDEGGRLPKAVLRFLRFGTTSGGGRQRYLSATHQQASVSGNGWDFRVRCRRIRPTDQPWTAKVRLKYGRDGGGKDLLRAIGHAEADGASEMWVESGEAFLQFPATVNAATIRGRTAPADMPALGTRAVLSIDVEGYEGRRADD